MARVAPSIHKMSDQVEGRPGGNRDNFKNNAPVIGEPSLARPCKPASPFRCPNSSPEVIRLMVMYFRVR
jgi:hypothetical protein